MITAERHPPTGLSPPRLRLEPTTSRDTVLDGGWWPRSTEAPAELPALIDALTSRRGPVTHVLLNSTDWDLPHPRRITVGGRTVRLGWFTSQPAGLLTLVCNFGRDRLDLLVVPAQSTPVSAEAALTSAADAHNTRRAPVLLAEIDRRA